MENLKFEVPLATDMSTAEPPKRFNDISQAYIRPTVDEDNPEVSLFVKTSRFVDSQRLFFPRR